MERACAEEGDPRDGRAHLFMHDVLKDFPIDLERLRAVRRAVSLGLFLSIFALRVPVPYEFRLGLGRGRRRC